MKKSLFLFILFCTCMGIQASPRTCSQARKIAEEFIMQKSVSLHKSVSSNKIHLAYKSKCKANDKPSYYIFNKAQGFIIVSGDDRLPEVLGYTDRGDFDWKNLPEALKNLLSQYDEEIDLSAYDLPKLTTKDVSVEPLLGDIKWGQNYPYNDLCPSGSTINGKFKSVVGCSAAALSQIMCYYKYPLVGTGVPYTYNTYSYKLKVSSNFNEPYDWDSILPEYLGNETSKQKQAVAHLCYDVGVSIYTDYGPSSGANILYVLGALPYFFNYDEDLSFLERDYYSYEEWVDILQKELNLKRPILYGSCGKYGGHSYVIDGCKDDYFHINWGWDGSGNGYFYLYGLFPNNSDSEMGVDDGLNYGNTAIIGIQKPDGKDDFGVRNCLVSDDCVFSSSSFDRMRSNKISFPVITNKSANFKGILFVELENILSHESLNLGTMPIASLDFFDSIYNSSINLDWSKVEDGNYNLICKERASNGTVSYGLRNLLGHDIDTFAVSVVDHQVSIETNINHSCKLSCDTILISEPIDTLYENGLTHLHFTLTNKGNYEFNSEYALRIETSKHKTVLIQNIVMILPHSSITLDFKTASSRLICGDSKIRLYINKKNNSMSVSDFLDMQLIYSRPVVVVENPYGKQNIQLEDAIKFINSSQKDIDEKNAILQVPLINLGGEAKIEVGCKIVDLSILKEVSTTFKSVCLKNNERDTLYFDYCNAYLFDNHRYRVSVLKYCNNNYSSFADSKNSMIYITWHGSYSAIDEVEIQGIYCNHSFLHNDECKALIIYNSIGKKMLSSSAPIISLSYLPSGIYFVVNGKKSMKILL